MQRDAASSESRPTILSWHEHDSPTYSAVHRSRDAESRSTAGLTSLVTDWWQKLMRQRRIAALGDAASVGPASFVAARWQKLTRRRGVRWGFNTGSPRSGHSQRRTGELRSGLVAEAHGAARRAVGFNTGSPRSGHSQRRTGELRSGLVAEAHGRRGVPDGLVGVRRLPGGVASGSVRVDSPGERRPGARRYRVGCQQGLVVDVRHALERRGAIEQLGG
jgi:hypothetical protein